MVSKHDVGSLQYGFFFYIRYENTVSEMPTSGDLKSFFTTPPEFQRTPPPPEKLTQGPNGNDLEHYMTSYMMFILSKFEIIVLMLEIIFVND